MAAGGRVETPDDRSWQWPALNGHPIIRNQRLQSTRLEPLIIPLARMESVAMTASKVAQQWERPPEELDALPKGMVMRAAVRETDASADP